MDVEVVVIGAGVVGIAVARALSLAGHNVIILDKNQAIGEETSSRNSEVIHAGIPYRPGGMRAALCVAGRDQLYKYCIDRAIDHRCCGKMIVACDAGEVDALEGIKRMGEANGVDDLSIINGVDAKRLEPALGCDAALVSPSSGIVDSHSLMVSLLGDFENAGGILALRSPVRGGQITQDGVTLQVGGASPTALSASLVINCAGLWAEPVARTIDGLPESSIPTIGFGRGIYFSYPGRAPFSRLIYPTPRADSLGLHYSLDLGGQAKFGPDIEYIDSNEDYFVDVTRRDVFARAIRRYWPGIDADRLTPGYAGIRPKTAPPGEEGDYIFSTAGLSDGRGVIGLFGIESPGLTACLAIGDHVASLIA